MLKYHPVIVNDDVYYPLEVIAEAFCLDIKFLWNLVNKTDRYDECLHNENKTFIPRSVFLRLKLPFDRPWLHFLYGYVRMNYLIQEIKRDTEFDFEEDDYFG